MPLNVTDRRNAAAAARRLRSIDRAAPAALPDVAEARYTPDGHPDPACPIVTRLNRGLAEALEYPEGRTRLARLAVVLRYALAAKHWELSCQLIAPGWITAEFSAAHRAVWTWYRTIPDGRRPERPLVLCVNRGGAKALTLDTPIPTPTGWTTMGDIAVGDLVLAADGTPTRVTDKSPVRLGDDCWRVTFDDGATLDTSGDHLWTVLTRQTRWQMSQEHQPPDDDGWWEWHARHGDEHARTVSTADMAAAGLTVGREQQYAIPHTAPLNLPDAALPIDPYWLGVWLGDGHTNASTITVGPADVDDAAALLTAAEYEPRRRQDPRSGAWALLFPAHRFDADGRHVCGRGHRTRSTRSGAWWCPDCQAGTDDPPTGLHARLRALGVLGKKHIPAAYLRASTAQRWALLQGLCDSDGTVRTCRGGPSASVSITTTSSTLADGIAELTASLGIPTRRTAQPARIDGRDCGTAHQIAIRPTGCPFRLPRKAGNWRRPRFHRLRRVESIEPIPTAPTACIAVDHTSSLYLAGPAMIPTHNTSTFQLVMAHVVPRHLRDVTMYVGAEQAGAGDKVSAVGGLLTTDVMRHAFPTVAEVYTAETGQRRDWRKDRIRTASGATIVAMGMDQAIRGVKLDEDRPGLILLDDLEDSKDTAATTRKKETTLTETIIPAGGDDVAIAYGQNRIHADSMMARLLDGRAEYLATRKVVGPIPQIDGLEIDDDGFDDDGKPRWKIVAGDPTWSGLGLAESQQQLNDEGPGAFFRERQHDDTKIKGDQFDADKWVMIDAADVGQLAVVCRAWDLAGSDAADADWTVGALFGLQRDGTPVIVDVIRFRRNPDGVQDMIRAITEQDQERYGRRCVAVLERQIGLAGKLWNRAWELDVLAGLAMDWAEPIGTKPERADLLVAVHQRARVKMVRADWNGAVLTETTGFPVGRNDDIVDALAHGYRWCAEKFRRRRTKLRTAAGTPLPDTR